MSSRVLLLTICSDSKTAGGERHYRSAYSITSELADGVARRLLQARREVLGLITSSVLARDGTPLVALRYNHEIQDGPDFGGRESGTYLPAARRYSGRLFRELGDDREQLLVSHHNVLIVSGLYGLLLPQEPIQRYSCHVADHLEVGTIWRAERRLTSGLINYMKARGVELVFDLMAERDYRELVDWNRVRRNARVLRAFGEQHAGPTLLPSLGQVLTALLARCESDLLSLPAGKTFATEYEEVVFTDQDQPPYGFVSQPPADARSRQLPERRDTPPGSEPVVAAVLADHHRDVPVRSYDHNTVFDRKIMGAEDLPNEVRAVLAGVSKAVDVVEIQFMAFRAHKGSHRSYRLRLRAPTAGSGCIDGHLVGPAKLGQYQDVRIRTTRHREEAVYRAVTEGGLADRLG